jgi:WD40 repeat protein
MDEQPEQPDKKPFLTAPWSIAAVSAWTAAAIGALGFTVSELWESFEAGDPGAGISFWVSMMMLCTIFGTISAVVGAGAGHLLSHILPVRNPFSSRVWPALAGVIVGAAVVSVGTPMLFRALSGPPPECPTDPGHTTTCFTLNGRGNVTHLAVSPDEQRLLTSSSYNAVFLWDAKSGEMISRIEPLDNPYEVESVAWSPDGAMFAAGLNNKTVVIWDSASLGVVRVLEGHGNAVWELAWAPDGQWIASGSVDHTVRVWDVETGTAIAVFDEPSEMTNDLAWSPDSRFLAIATRDRHVRIWNVAQASLVADRSFQDKVFGRLAWSPDGSMLASGLGDGTIVIWGTTAWHPIAQLLGQGDRVMSLAWDPHSARLVSSYADQQTVIWDVQSEISTKGLAGSTNSRHSQVFWIDDGRAVLVVWGNDVTVWQLND